jgi:hypothetical protein
VIGDDEEEDGSYFSAFISIVDNLLKLRMMVLL